MARHIIPEVVPGNPGTTSLTATITVPIRGRQAAHQGRVVPAGLEKKVSQLPGSLPAAYPERRVSLAAGSRGRTAARYPPAFGRHIKTGGSEWVSNPPRTLLVPSILDLGKASIARR